MKNNSYYIDSQPAQTPTIRISPHLARIEGSIYKELIIDRTSSLRSDWSTNPAHSSKANAQYI